MVEITFKITKEHRSGSPNGVYSCKCWEKWRYVLSL